MAAFWCTAGDTIYLHHFRFSFSKQFLSSFTHLDSLYFHFSSFSALLFLYFSLFPVQLICICLLPLQMPSTCSLLQDIFCNTFPCLHISQFVHNTVLHFLDINICRMVFYAYFTICVSATFDNEIGHQVHAELLSLLQLFTLLLLSFLVNFSC